jgi:hypothetical protein
MLPVANLFIHLPRQLFRPVVHADLLQRLQE